MANGVRFIRVHGRVVPLRQPTGQRRAPARQAPKREPLVTKTKAVFLAAAVGLGAYFLARRFKLSKNAKLADLQKAVQSAGGKLGVVTDVPHAQTEANRVFETVIGMKHNSEAMKGGVVLNRGVDAKDFYEPLHTINPYKFALHLDSKRLNRKIINPAAMPKTMLFENALKKAGHKGKRLSEIFPKFLVKKDASAMNSASSFANESTITLKKNLHHFAHPQNYVMQERLDLVGEYRAHMLNGEVFGITHRRITNKTLGKIWQTVSPQGGGAFVPVLNPFERARIKKLIKSNVSLKSLAKNESAFAAFDIGKTDKGLKILEGNTAPGTFAFNPFVNRRFKELATGRMSRAKAGAIGAGAGGATYKLAAPSDDKKKK